VTKNLELVPLPHPLPVNKVIEEYRQEELPKRRSTSADHDILDEITAGLGDYFSNAIGKVLLYKFERPQYQEIRGLWEKVRRESPLPSTFRPTIVPS
jgi:mortality factor 4-like protein 1